jgi:hypothetical protein
MYSVFALVRFSFLSSDNKGYRLTKNLQLEEKKERLFSASRLTRRFEIFEHVCLPSLIAQDPERFGAVVLASDLMPHHFKKRLEVLLSPHPNILPTFEKPQPMPYSEAFLNPLRQLDQVSDVILTCRLDDDDALASDYTKQALEYVNGAHIGHCLTYPKGLQATNVEGKPRFWESYYPLIGAGLGFIDRLESGKTVFDCGHHQKVWKKFPTIVDGRLPQYLVTLHDENDSTSRRRFGKQPWWKRFLTGRQQPAKMHPNDLRNPPEDALTLEGVRARYPDCFAPLNESDWDFL